MSDALESLQIIDFSRVLAGPLATMVLADFGAEVIKVERPGSGDDTRAWGPPYDETGMATYFQAVNRNKRSVLLDLHASADRERAQQLVAGADVLVENFRPGLMDDAGARLRGHVRRESGARLLLDHRIRLRARGSDAAGLRHARAGARWPDEHHRLPRR